MTDSDPPLGQRPPYVRPRACCLACGREVGVNRRPGWRKDLLHSHMCSGRRTSRTTELQPDPGNTG